MMSYSVVYPLTRFEYIIFNNIDIVRYFFFFFEYPLTWIIKNKRNVSVQGMWRYTFFEKKISA